MSWIDNARTLGITQEPKMRWLEKWETIRGEKGSITWDIFFIERHYVLVVFEKGLRQTHTPDLMKREHEVAIEHYFKLNAIVIECRRGLNNPLDSHNRTHNRVIITTISNIHLQNVGQNPIHSVGYGGSLHYPLLLRSKRSNNNTIGAWLPLNKRRKWKGVCRSSSNFTALNPTITRSLIEDSSFFDKVFLG